MTSSDLFLPLAVVFFDVAAGSTPLGRIEMTVSLNIHLLLALDLADVQAHN